MRVPRIVSDVVCTYTYMDRVQLRHSRRDPIPMFSSFKRVSLYLSHPDPSAFLLLSLLILSTKTVHSASESAGIHAPIDITVKVSRRYRNYYTG